MSEATEKALDRVRKLLALAGNNSNEEEAARAAEKAQEILAEHNLSIADIKTDADKDERLVEDDELITNQQQWRRDLGNIVAELYFCQYLFLILPGYKDQHTFIGAKHNVEVAKLFFTYLHMAVDRLAIAGAKEREKSMQSTYRTTFRKACTARLYRRIQDRINAAKRGQIVTESGKNLPALLDVYEASKTQIMNYVKNEYGMDSFRVARARNVSTKVRDDGAYRDGLKAGDSIGLDQQLKRDRAAAIAGKKVVRHVVTYGKEGTPRYCVMRADDKRVIFRNDAKSACILEAQKVMGLTPVDGDEQTYGRQIAEMGWR
jgi:hypothetical protein